MKFTLRYSIIIGLSFCLALFSCKKEESDLGIEGYNNNSKITGTLVDTLTIRTYNTVFDSITTTGLSRNALGHVNSTEFGLSTASIFASFESLDDTVSWPTNATLDSISVEFTILAAYGKGVDQTIEVFKMDTNVVSSDTYYSNSTIGYSTKVGEFKINSDTTSSIVFRLDDVLGNDILGSSTDLFAKGTALLSLVKGLAFVPKQNLNADEGKMYAIPHGGIHLKLAFQENGSPKVKTFGIPSNRHLFSPLTKDYTTGNVNTYLADTTKGNDRIFIQGLGGTRISVELPTIRNWYAASNKVITQAKLIIPYVEPVVSEYGNIDTLTISRSIDGVESPIERSAGTNDFLGIYNETAKQYEFTIGYDLNNGLLKSTENYKYQIDLWGFAVNAQQSILNGQKPSSGAAAKLEIHYSGY